MTEVILVHCNIVNNDYQEYYTLLFQINLLVAYWKFLQQIIFFKKHLTQNMIKLKDGS